MTSGDTVGHTGTNIEESVLAIWREVFGESGLQAHDDFLASGGHSFLAARIIARIFQQFAVEMDFEAFFSDMTPASMAAAIARRSLHRDRSDASRSNT